MVWPEVEQLIDDYLSNTATIADLDKLSEWLLLEGNQELFDTYVQSHLEIATTINDPDTDKIKRMLLRRMKRDKKKKMLLSAMKYAAVVVLFLGLGYVLQLTYFAKQESNSLQPNKDEHITITLGNGQVETLNDIEKKIVKDANGNIIGTQENSKLVYSNNAKTGELVYNTLYVPYGKQFNLVLSDGTQVFLNSGTSLRYPMSFLEGKERSVFLTGEAYFEVSEDKMHPFVVHAKGLEVQVVGTKFNVSHYPEDTHINTVLVEGSVTLQITGEVSGDEIPTMLEPGTKGEWLKSGNTISVDKVDTRIYTAWTKGRLVFRNMSFEKIRQALERHYNVTIINNNLALDEQMFDATFDIETIDQVLESFSKSYAIAYGIENNQVIIN